jgi:hypothetical protein
MRSLLILLLLPVLATAAPARDAHGRIARSHKAVAEFKRVHPCPSTGKVRGRCSGWVVDHVTALACNGVDRPENMQWQSVADAKAKDKWERIGCDAK